MNRRAYLAIIILAITTLAFSLFLSKRILNKPQQLVGADKDEHGCLGSAGYSWCELKKKCLRIWEDPCSDDKTTVVEVANKFYAQYETCMKEPPFEATGKVGEYCQENIGYTSKGFVNNLGTRGTAKAGADPIVCAQSVPESINVVPDFEITDDKVTLLIEEKFGTITSQNQLQLVKEDGIWKVDSVICTHP